jgi:hypothetical protein
MKQDLLSDITNLYDETFQFLEEEGIADNLPAPGPNRTEYQNTFRTVPEKYLLKDNLLLLLKDI